MAPGTSALDYISNLIPAFAKAGFILGWVHIRCCGVKLRKILKIARRFSLTANQMNDRSMEV